MKQMDRNIERTLAMTKKLVVLSEEGEVQSQDPGCAVLYGVVRDCAHRMRVEAEREREAHRRAEVYRRMTGKGGVP